MAKTKKLPLPKTPLEALELIEAQNEAGLIPVHIRLPKNMIEELRVRADQIGIGYQSLIKVYLADSLKRERQTNPL